MKDPLHVAVDERDVLRVFVFDAPEKDLSALLEEKWDEVGTRHWDLPGLLGVAYLDSDFIEDSALTDFPRESWADYLIGTWNVPPEALLPLAPALAACTGTVLLVDSQAFGGFETRISPRPPLRFLGALPLRHAPSPAQPLFQPEPQQHPLPEPDIVRFDPPPAPQHREAENTPAPNRKRPKSDARIGGMVATVVLLALAVFVIWFIWSAG